MYSRYAFRPILLQKTSIWDQLCTRNIPCHDSATVRERDRSQSLHGWHSRLGTNKIRARRSTEEGVGHHQTLWTQTEREKVRIWCHRIDVLRRKANTPGNQARSGQSCWNLQHSSTHDQRGSTESTWHGKLHGQVCAELGGKDYSPETTATREERLAVGSRTGKGMARHKRLLHDGTTPEVL